MPVVIKPSSHGANAYRKGAAVVDNAKDLLLRALPGHMPDDIEVYQSSWGHGSAKLDKPTVPSTNGLVNALMLAYGQHHHLVVRPEDVWFAILTQFSFYVNAHAEELRRLFVSHDGQKEIRLEYDPFSRYDFDFSVFASDVGRVLGAVIVDADFRSWLMPDFTTTNDNDRVVASIIMMGTMQEYYSFTCGIICGFPSVTLMGEKSDYEAILRKLDKLDGYGKEPQHFAELLRPVLKRFIWSFDDPAGAETNHFWRTAFDLDDRLCGVDWCTGWISAFCFWDKRGKCLYNEQEYKRTNVDPGRLEIRRLALDGVRYHGIEKSDVPPAWVKVPVTIEQSGGNVAAEMFAGVMGITLESGNPTSDLDPSSKPTAEGGDLNTTAPVAAWWITENMGPKLQAQEKREEERMQAIIDRMGARLRSEG